MHSWSEKFILYDISTYAASASFFIITSLFPMLMLIFSIVSCIPWASETVLVDGIVRLLPKALLPFFLPIIQELQDSSLTSLSISVVAMLWTSSKSMMGVLGGLNNIAGIRDNRSFLFKRMVCSGFMLLLALVLMIMLVLWGFGQMILELVHRYIPYLGNVFSMILEVRGLALFVVTALILAMMYAFFPHKKMHLVMQLPGALFAAAAWLIFSQLYSMYVEYALTVSMIYGSLGMIVLAMLWLYFCMMILFFGAVINQLLSGILENRKAVCK